MHKILYGDICYIGFLQISTNVIARIIIATKMQTVQISMVHLIVPVILAIWEMVHIVKVRSVS